ncbi:transcriptional regulator [Methylobacterium indicum]|uniref:Transcriptional regulator n=2 Tax=Methylobacterium indicum TaxID=1775910 RepID=A0ABR5HHJ6_9HYPH|nr:transcriptional regulator [Methylobacterium indicum]KMO26146.1 transcriptional regulator [Methylobacterium indicum]
MTAPPDRQIGFILLPGFALMSFASASEPFRAANRLAGHTLYRMRFFGEDPSGRVAASSGVEVPVEPLPRDHDGLYAVFVCAGGEPKTWNRPAVQATLRRLARRGTRIGGISGGPYVMAAAGLLTDRDFTIHWEHAGALREAFPDLVPKSARFVIAGDRMTCGGGVAPIDMMLAVITEHRGREFALLVSDWFLHTAAVAPEDPQRASPAERYGIHHPILLAILQTMERTLDAPMDRREMAALGGLSERHLDRLFRDKMGISFSEHYRNLRLDHAQRLLRQSTMSMGRIAMASGFSGAGQFSRSYRARFGHTPSNERKMPDTQ